MMMATQLGASTDRLYGAELDLNALDGKQDEGHKRDVHIHLSIPKKLQEKVIYTKIEGPLSDTHHQPGREWIEEFTGVREGHEPGWRGINVKDGDSVSQGIPSDAGLIITFAGTCAPEQVAIDTQTQEIMSEEQAQLKEETFDRQYPRYNLWQFRIKHIVKTDGPIRAQRLSEAAEEQRARAEEESFDRMGKGFESVFARLMEMIEKRGGVATPEAAQMAKEAEAQVSEQQKEEARKTLNPDQAAALEELEDWEKEDGGKKNEAPQDAPSMEVGTSKKKK